MDDADYIRELHLVSYGVIMVSSLCKGVSLFQELHFEVLGMSDVMSVIL